MKKRFAGIMLVFCMFLTACGAGSGTTEGVDVPSTDVTTNENQAALTETVRVASLKGATSIGLVKLMDDAANETTIQPYDMQMYVAADEIVPLLIKGDIDIAAIPTNLAATLFQKTEGKIVVININTLGVLSMVEAGETIGSMADLEGKTIYMTGKGTTPEYVLKALLKANNISEDDVTLEFKSEPTEVAAILAKDASAVGMLPQPFATVASKQNDKLRVALDLTKEWEAVYPDSALLTGVTVVRKEFLDEHPESVDQFLLDHKASVDFANNNIEETAALVEAADIVKAQVAIAAIPQCNITYIDGADMEKKVSGYLKVLMEQDPQSVGGELPDETFYYKK